MSEKYTWQQFDEDCITITEFAKKQGVTWKNIYGIPRGGLALAVKLSFLLKIDLITNQDEITKDTLIVDDISDSGETIGKLLASPQIKTCPDVITLFIHQNSTFKPVFWVREKRERWIDFPWEM